MKHRIGIFGGSFNPVHLGHLNIAETACREFNLQKVIFIPCKVSPFKTNNEPIQYISDQQRVDMLKLSIKGRSGFQISEIELNRGGISYSYDTIVEIKKSYPDSHLSFIIGTDSLLTLSKWYKIGALLNLCDFVTVERPRMDRIDEKSLGFSPELSKHLLLKAVRGRPMDISSSGIREKVARGLSLQGVVTPEVEKYISQHGLYRSCL
ncbi:MAG: nicotinate (nicotinamide) nucleotide adenylyltransferase [Kiritimatiellae bacterium]|jgi:nicotinate-nucleotide adenylyltransferase|nr:nicotinate (nicotinamide) nucleotide adenylyltransferase [Kiritimatiellia bacterium]